MQSKQKIEALSTPDNFTSDPWKQVYGNQPSVEEEFNIVPHEHKILNSVNIKNDCTVSILATIPTVLYI